MIVHVDRQRCCSAGMCVLTAPEVFDQREEDGTVLLLRQPRTDQEAAVRDAVGLCPSGALVLARP